MLEELTTKAGHRLSGSPGAAAAVKLTHQMMATKGFDNVHVEPVIVPHWIRGPIEEAAILDSRSAGTVPLSICALGGSVGTPDSCVLGEVVEVRTFDELRKSGERIRDKIVFFNRALDPTKINTFEAYGGAVEQRSRGAIEAASMGAVAVLVRSMTLALDDVPHTGQMSYADNIRKIPGAAISTMDANMLSDLIRTERSVWVRMKLTCETLPDVPSANVVGEITGSERPREIIVVGGHLDAWDKGTGAHDDGAGCIQAIEVLNILKRIGVRPKRTIRAVLFMNEENGLRGARAYPLATQRAGETHIAAIESDRGGFGPRGISVQADSSVFEKVKQWKHLFEAVSAGTIFRGYSGVDVSPLVEKGTPGFGLVVEDHRYFDYHHSDNDTVDKVHPRELEMGAIVEALLCYLIAENGL
jgi:hypothetical protein